MPKISRPNSVLKASMVLSVQPMRGAFYFGGDAMTWQEMCEKEPRLKQLQQDCINYLGRHPKEYDREIAWYRVFKKRMQVLVGFMAKNDDLSSCECYDVAYKTLTEALEV